MHTTKKDKEDLQKKFAPYEISLKIKELGFDELCIAGWFNYTNPDSPICLIYKDSVYGENAMLKNSNEIYKNLPTEITYGNCTAPLWQESFDFFETQFGIHVTFVPRSWDTNKIKWSFWGNCIIDGNHFFNLDLGDGDRQDDSYDFIFEAKLEAIKLLIDYVKSEQYQNISKTKGKA